VKPRLAQPGQRLFQLVEFSAGEVQSGVVEHWRAPRKGEPSFYYLAPGPLLGSRIRPLQRVLPNHRVAVIEFLFSSRPAIPLISMTYWQKSGLCLEDG
jgi:hypothetical protein